MNRTVFAALSATVLVGGSLAGLGVFLGFPTGAAIWFGVIVGAAGGLLLLAASRRADSFHPTEDNAHLADHRTGSDRDARTRTDGPDDAVDDHPDPRPGA